MSQTTPNSLTQKDVKEWLLSKGATPIIHASNLALIIGRSISLIDKAIKEKKLTTIGPRTMTISDSAKWLLENPKYLVMKQ